MIQVVHQIRIRILIFYPSRIPDPGVKKASDPGSESETLALEIIWRLLSSNWHILLLCGRFLVEKAEQVKTASIISAEGDTEAADLLASAFAKAGEGLVSTYPIHCGSVSGRIRKRVLVAVIWFHL
jgi:hypothetical protein